MYICVIYAALPSTALSNDKRCFWVGKIG